MAAVGIAAAGITITGTLLLYQLHDLESARLDRITWITEDFHPHDSAHIGIRDPDASDIISLNARWNKPIVTMSVAYDETIDAEFQENSLERIKRALHPSEGTYPYANWNDLLYKVKTNFGNAPILEYTDDFEDADIQLYLTNELHPEGKIGFTRLGIDRLTKEILFVEMYGFGLNQLVDSNVNAVALQHGIGHALGLSHTNYNGSVMYPRVVSVDGIAIGAIGPCEENAMVQIYVRGLFHPVTCESGLMTEAIQASD